MLLLEVHGLHAHYGAIAALRGVSFNVEAGQVVSLIGAKGAGKSTALNTISGLLRPIQGHIIFDGQNITGWRADQIAALGLAQVPAGRQVTTNMTVTENLMMGAFRRSDSAAVYADLEDIFQRFPRLEERRRHKAGSLNGEEQQMLAVCRALMAKPRLLMLDEPSIGLPPLLANEVFTIIAEIKAQGIPILLVEQDARRALQIADYAYVLERGQIAHEGPAAVLRQDPHIISAYLG